mmetsp:Transcript_21224/g.58891  ORF Transcript_21224/g.58891 Transcript_21224/m.58891 type:complete len:98 (-) Transcript_21224:1752-2045(-)
MIRNQAQQHPSVSISNAIKTMAMQFKLQSGMAQQHHDASIPEPLALVATLVWFVAALTAWSYVQASSWLYKRLGAAAMKLLGTQPHKTTHSCILSTA